MYKALLALLIILSFTILTPTISHAQTSYDWTCDFNFLTGQEGWITTKQGTPYDYSMYVASFGFRRASVSNTQARLTILSPVLNASVSSVSVYLNKAHTLGSGGAAILFKGTTSINNGTWATPYGSGAVINDFTYNGTPFAVTGTDRFGVSFANATAPNGTAFPTDLYIERVILEGDGTMPTLSQCVQNIPPQPQLYAPIKQIQLTEVGNSNNATHIYWIADYATPVHAMMSGTVEYVGNTTTSLGMSYTRVEISNGSGYRISQYISSGTSPTSFDTPNLSVGDTINASCVLGYVFKGVINVPYGIAHRTESELLLNGTPVEYTNAYLPAEESPYCGASDTETEQCLGDATFRSLEWNIYGNASINETGVLLGSGASISITMNLSSTKWTELRAVFDPERSGIVELTLGQTVQQFRVPEETALIPEALHAPDVGTFYTIKARNIGSGNLYLSYLCVRITKDDEGNPIDPSPLTPIPTCKLANSNFIAGLTSWETSDTFNPVTYSNLQAHIPFGEYIYQTDVTLTPGTYTLTAIVTLDYDTATLPFSTDSVSVLFSYPSLTPTDTLGSFFVSTMVSSNYKVLSTTFEVTTSSTGSFYLFAQSSTADATGIGVSSICITGDKIKTASCYPVPDPVGSGVGEWTNWLWINFNKFFECELMPTLNDINNIVTRQFIMLGWSIRYQLASADQTTSWLGSDLLPWLAGYLSNIQPGTVTVEETCNNIFCVILGGIDLIGRVVDIFGQLLNLAGSIVQQVLGMAGSFVAQISALFDNANYLFNAISNAYANTTPATIPILPTCTANPRSSGFCVVSWMLENTILSGTGALFIPLIISFASILWIIWAVKEIKKTILESGLNL